MKVYILLEEVDYQNWLIEAVYANKEKAEAELRKHDMRVTNWRIDEEDVIE